MIIKSLIIASILCNLVGLSGLATKFDQAVIRNEFNPSQTVLAAADSPIELPLITQRPQVKPFAPKANIYAKEYILVDSESGTVLLKQAANERVPIASTTKIMSAIIVLENYKLDDVVTISSAAANQIGASANFRVGEHLTVHDLLKAMLIKSANGAAYALAEHMNDFDENGKPIKNVGISDYKQTTSSNDITVDISSASDDDSAVYSGTVDPNEKPRIAKFVDAMNTKAKELGMKNTEYHDPAGLDVTGYSSAYDLYLATKYALTKDVFAEIVKSDHDVIKNVEGNIWHDLKNSNRLVAEYKYPGAIGVKTGYMPEAGHVLVSAARRDGHTLIGVVINTYADTAPASADESRKLLDWGFENVEY